MELRIDPSFPPAFERLRKGARKKSHQVRDALIHAARSGQGLPQKDKLILPWKQHRRTIFWVRIDRAIRLMYEQDGEVQTVLYVGKHQEAEAFLRTLPPKASESEVIPLAEWLQRTAPPAAARTEKSDKDRKLVSDHTAQRQLVQALENLLEDCLLNFGPAVVEEYASPHLIEWERRLAELTHRIAENTKVEQREREQLRQCVEELRERTAHWEKTLHAQRAALDPLSEHIAALQQSFVGIYDDARRETVAAQEETRLALRSELAALRDEQANNAAQWRRQLHAAETRLTDLGREADDLRGEMRTRIDEMRAEVVEARGQMGVVGARIDQVSAEQRAHARAIAQQLRREFEEKDRRHRERAEGLERRLAEQELHTAEMLRIQEVLLQRIAHLEQRAAEQENRGWLEMFRRLWGRRSVYATRSA